MSSSIVVYAPLIAEIWRGEIEKLLPDVVANLETDVLTDRAQRNLGDIMRSDTEHRQWLLHLREELVTSCTHRDPITLDQIPELLRCTISSETGHIFCYNILSLLTLIQSPLRYVHFNTTVNQFLSRDYPVVNPLTNVRLSVNQVNSILTKANRLVILLYQLSRE